MDAAADLPPQVVDPAAVLDQERQLFYVAATRARRRLIATSVVDQDTVPSRFLFELAGSEEDLPTGWPTGRDGAQRRGLQLTDLVADLRRAVTDPAAPEHVVAAAATQLARLSEAGVVGAHPREWYGLAGLTTQRPPVAAGTAVTVTPSTVDSLMSCGLRGVLERRGARGAVTPQQIEGIVVHALVDGLAKGVGRTELVGEMERFLALQQQLPPWLLARTRRALEKMLVAAEQWISTLPADRTLAGSEVPLSVRVPPVPADDGDPPRPPAVDPLERAGPGPDNGGPEGGARPTPREVILTGRSDRIDRTGSGTMIIVDFKTGATVPSKASVAENAQLAVYQLALHLGAADRLAAGSGEPALSGGAELVYLRTGSPNVRYQPPLDDPAARQWQQTVRTAAERLASSASQAQEGRWCERCPVRSSCPLQPDGRQVTR
jgi:hypothetical protein